MTRLRAMQAVLAVLVVVMIWSWTRTPPSTVRPPSSRPARPSAARPRASAPALDLDATVRRNLFEYGEAPARATAVYVPVTPTAATPMPIATAAPPPLKLVGLVQQAGGLRAALAVEGDIVLGAPGQEVAGFTITSIEEDGGVVLRAADGTTLELRREEPR